MNFIEKVKVSASLAGETSNFCFAIKVNFCTICLRTIIIATAEFSRTNIYISNISSN